MFIGEGENKCTRKVVEPICLPQAEVITLSLT